MILCRDHLPGVLHVGPPLLWLCLAGWLAGGCATTAGATAGGVSPEALPLAAPTPAASAAEPAATPAGGAEGQAQAPDAVTDGEDAEDEAEDSTEACTDCAEAPDSGEEAEPHVVAPPGDHTVRYTQDLSDADLEQRFVHDLPSLGSISVGFTDEGRLVNGVQMPSGETWRVTTPAFAYGTAEVVQDLEIVADAVHAAVPQAGPLRVNHISRKDGGYARPHRSHQSGRDVDLGLFYQGGGIPGGRRARERLVDPAANWAVIRALATSTDVQLILLDRRVQKVIRDHALAAGEDRAWVDSLFGGSNALVRHARRHRDHFHVRFYSPRAQELGRRVQPLLARRPDQNLAHFRVRRGDTLGHIALRFGTTTAAIRKANHLKGSALRVSQVLLVPLRGPCTRCPLPAPVVVPPRRLPPDGMKPAEPSPES